MERFRPPPFSELIQRLMNNGPITAIKRLQLYGIPHLISCITLALTQNETLEYSLIACLIIILPFIPLLFNFVRISLSLHIFLIMLSCFSLSINVLDNSNAWGISGIILGGWFIISTWIISLVVMTQFGSKGLSRFLLFIHTLFIPFQMIGFIFVGLSIADSSNSNSSKNNDNNNNNSNIFIQIEGSIWLFISLFFGYIVFSLYSNKIFQLQHQQPETEQDSLNLPLLSKKVTCLFIIEILISILMGIRVIIIGIYKNYNYNHNNTISYWIEYVWSIIYTQSVCFIFIGTLLTVFICLPGRKEFLSHIFIELFGNNFIHSTTYTYLASSPASVVLIPIIIHFVIMLIPLIIILGCSLFLDSTSEYIHLLYGELIIGLTTMVLLVISSYLEASKPSYKYRIIFYFNIIIVSFGLAFKLFSCVILMNGPRSLIFKYSFISIVFFWELYTLYIVWCMFSISSRNIIGELWSYVFFNHFIFSSYYAQDDAKESGEASCAYLIGGVILTFLLFSLDLTSFILCGRKGNIDKGDRCSKHVFSILSACVLSNILWLISSILIIGYTRLKSPPAIIFPTNVTTNICSCFGIERLNLLFSGHLWILDICQRFSQLIQIILMILLFTYSCSQDDEQAHGRIRAIMITSGVFRLIAFPPIFIIDFASKEERRNAYTNAIGTAMLLRMQRDTLAAENDPTRNGINGGDVEQQYGTIGHYTLEGNTVEGKTGRLRVELSQLRIPWEEGHEELVFHRPTVLQEAQDAYMLLEPKSFYKTFRFDFLDEPGLDAGGLAREFVAVICEELITKTPGLFIPVERDDSKRNNDNDGDDDLIRYQIKPHPNSIKNPISKDILLKYLFVGRFLGKSLFDGHTTLRLAKPLYAAILNYRSGSGGGGSGNNDDIKNDNGKHATMEDLLNYDAPLYHQLIALQSTNDNIEDLCLDFSVNYDMETLWNDKEKKHIEEKLKPSSSTSKQTITKPKSKSFSLLPQRFNSNNNIEEDNNNEEEAAAEAVTNDNIDEYIELRWKKRVISDISEQLKYFIQGIDDVFPRSKLNVFNISELELLMSGINMIDINDWKEYTQYTGEFIRPPPPINRTNAISHLLGRGGRSGGDRVGRGHQGKVISWFWEWVNELSQIDRQRLLRFCTGSSGVPIGGFAQLLGNDGRVCHFTLQSLPYDDKAFPRAHTCFNRIDLPLYKTKEELKEVLSKVIGNDNAITGFGID